MGTIKRIGVLTGGGDCPGLNAVIRAVTKTAMHEHKLEVVGVQDGFLGLIQNRMHPLEWNDVSNILTQGGTILGTSNQANPRHFAIERGGKTEWCDVTDRVLDHVRANDLDALVCIGGDGTMTGASNLVENGINCIGVPKTIDNDLENTAYTFGFETAVEFASECIDRLFSTATSHGRIIVVEVMGRYAGWIALHAGMSAGAHAILIPEIPFRLEPVAALITGREERGAKFSIVCVAEGAHPVGGELAVIEKQIGRAERLGGIGAKVAAELERMTGREARTVVLGHLLRGGSPTSFDRLLGLRFGAAAVRALDDGQDGVMVALNPPTVDYVPLEAATRRQKQVPLDCDTLLTARDLGINFGDAMPTNSAIGR
jgi:ATP-dependent phosphofructokinase / diphosphate-dependent phosphofructokinase